MSWVESIKLDGEHPRPRFAHAADLLKSHMYIFGGVTDIPTYFLFHLETPKLTTSGKSTL